MDKANLLRKYGFHWRLQKTEKKAIFYSLMAFVLVTIILTAYSIQVISVNPDPIIQSRIIESIMSRYSDEVNKSIVLIGYNIGVVSNCTFIDNYDKLFEEAFVFGTANGSNLPNYLGISEIGSEFAQLSSYSGLDFDQDIVLMDAVIDDNIANYVVVVNMTVNSSDVSLGRILTFNTSFEFPQNISDMNCS
ncbi:hypothetical protein K9M79_04010 [Candidatus Woesearchaeota archaeon]|nr:hypothetical protein [Candidatus Woesearchaeota archaeon]